MAATILDGKAISKQIQAELELEVFDFIQNSSVVPTLATVLVGEDPASQVYIRGKHKACERVGMESRHIGLDADTTLDELLEVVGKLNKDRAVHGILVQLPLPAQINETKVLDAIHPLKDVDCFHPENVGRLSQGRPNYLPCTPHGVLQILHRSGIETIGKHCVVVGRSEIVGKPMASLLVQKDSTCGPTAANATVTVCHSRTTNLPEVTRSADILIAAIGRPKFITAEMVKPGATVIDVGINRTDEGLVGDVDFEPVAEIAGAITPVPGGVGPLTIAMLMYNTLKAAERQIV
ncbi:MAG: bifunctional methylenetetrahydrofolate dehydrogenase/methenyltetrahydrofolate cyclohydrolase FolD [Planctomycetota bacterium]